MPFVAPNWVFETTTVEGTGPATLLGVSGDYLDFDSQLANGDTVPYTIEHGTDKESGIGTFSTTGPTITRTTVLRSTNGDAAVVFTAGTKNIYSGLDGVLLQSLIEQGAADGILAQIASNTYARREIEVSKNLQVTNPAGTAGNIQINSSFISPKDGSYGGKGDGITNDTAAVNACIAAAEAVGDKVILEEGDWLVSGFCLQFTKGIVFQGEGDRSRILVDPSVTGSTDILNLSPSTTTDDVNTNFHLSDFRIEPVSGTPGRHGIAVDISNRALYQSSFKRIRIDQLGGEAFATLPAVTPLSDGFFTSTIENCILYGGIKLDKAGDSLRILRNTITGTGVGVYVDLWCNTPGVDCFDGGPHGLEILGNNITCIDGALDCRNASMGIFENNVVEVPAGGTLHNSATVSIDGLVTNPIRSFTIGKNYLSTSAGNDVVYLGYAEQCKVSDNYSTRVIGQVHYRVSANAVNTRLIDCFHAGDEARATILDDQGSQTLWWRTWAGKIEQNQGIVMDADKFIEYKDSGGIDHKMIYLDTVDDNIKVGFTSSPTKAGGGFLLFYADGTERMRIVPGGQVLIGNPAFPAGLNPKVSAALQIESTTQGFYPPRMTTTQKNAITTPEQGCTVYDITLGGLSFYNGAGWITAIA